MMPANANARFGNSPRMNTSCPLYDEPEREAYRLKLWISLRLQLNALKNTGCLALPWYQKQIVPG
jgi:hypothetical protein